jgi:hypothetical protein
MVKVVVRWSSFVDRLRDEKVRWSGSHLSRESHTVKKCSEGKLPMNTNKPVLPDAEYMRQNFSRYAGRTLRSIMPHDSGAYLLTFDGDLLRPLIVPVSAPHKLTARQRLLSELLSGSVLYWTVEDLLRALGLRYSQRMAGQIGRDLRHIHAGCRRSLELNNGKFNVYSAYPIKATVREIRERYYAQKRLRLKASGSSRRT